MANAQTDSGTTEQLSVNNLCTICGKTSSVYCPRCRLVGYCSHDHRLQHWDSHDRECIAVHPVKVKKFGPAKDNKTLFTRNAFKSGSMIFFDSPIIRGPDDSLLSPDAVRYCFLTSSKQRSTCITCCSLVLDGRLCAKCQWPVCSEKCAQDPTHAHNECLVFNGKPETEFHLVKPSRFVFILRCLLAKEMDLKTWNKILSLETNPMARNFDFFQDNLNSATISELKQQQAIERDTVTDVMHHLRHFHLQKRFQRSVVSRVVGILNWNAVPMQLGSQKENMLLYPRITVAQHSCTPNGLWSMRSVFQLFCYARTDIGLDEALSISRIPDESLLLCTKIRQKQLRSIGIHCTCDRCVSPTELNSHFSTVKCINFEFFDPVKGCIEGNLVPQDPCDSETLWECQACHCTRSGKLIQNYMTRLQLEIDESKQFASSLKYKSVDFSTAQSLSDLLGLNNMISLIKLHEKKTLHENHAILFHAKYFVLKHLSEGILEIFHLNISIDQSLSEMLVEAAKYAVKLCDECLPVLAIILPGLSLKYGELLYHKQFCLGVLLPDQLSRQKNSFDGTNILTFRKDFENAKQTRERARFVLSFYRDSPSVGDTLESMNLDELLYSTIQKNFDQCDPKLTSGTACKVSAP